MKRWLLFLCALTILTGVLFACLYWLASVRIDWIVTTADPSRPEFQRHGRPVFAPLGFLIWVVILACYAVATVSLARKLLSRGGRPAGNVRATLSLLIASVVLVAVVHPRFLLTVAPPAFQDAVVGTLMRLAPLRDIYEHWGIARQVWWIFLLQVLLGLGAALLLQRRERPASA
jgi:hypothetical protein